MLRVEGICGGRGEHLLSDTTNTHTHPPLSPPSCHPFPTLFFEGGGRKEGW